MFRVQVQKFYKNYKKKIEDNIHSTGFWIPPVYTPCRPYSEAPVANIVWTSCRPYSETPVANIVWTSCRPYSETPVGNTLWTPCRLH